ncbi:MAG: DUF1847 domain-containing protein [Desulfotignum sp.]|nr:DUF1847 domain-containing protein [Desulfotignum sp.]MCF8086501.1 DUF1847 domain-containing protein [Desulfotignum sp.]MCF8135903.1 DUF1847 domain-containing protein [Desulfotignum sp.]
MAHQNKDSSPACAACDIPMEQKICFTDQGKGPKGCPTVSHPSILEAANQAYAASDVNQFAHMASVQEAQCYANRDQKPYVMQPCKTRIVETCEFAKKMGYQRLGLAFCLGLASEAGTVGEIFSDHGFEVVSVCCKAGRSSKDLIGIEEEDKIFKGTDESMCNPVFQAMLLNQENVDFNILLGLCVGHDSLFFKYTEVPTTVLAVKDRVTGHNPLAAVYQADSYYRKIRHPDL